MEYVKIIVKWCVGFLVYHLLIFSKIYYCFLIAIYIPKSQLAKIIGSIQWTATCTYANINQLNRPVSILPAIFWLLYQSKPVIKNKKLKNI